ncbi:MAG: efflux RND transporter periplasmic adaptor subunit [Verrucomicrobiae bacterium]|nr:efflux RND transporter periplasmic adaptor subunit [Verrucomicrobiae bacterium]
MKRLASRRRSARFRRILSSIARRGRSRAAVSVCAAVLLAGCGGEHPSAEEHRHGAEHAAGEACGHDEKGEVSSGARFDPDKGVLLSEETRRSLGIETAEATKDRLPLEIRFTPQVFDETPRVADVGGGRIACAAKASGLIAREQAALLRDGMPVRLVTQAGNALGGVVLKVHPAVTLAFGDAEVVAGVTNAGARLAMGEFLAAVVTIPRDAPVLVVPKAAVLRSVEGASVYAAHGGAFRRVEVKTGAETEEGIEITEGLNAGDAVAVRAVETLRLIELRATKGGGHSH